MAIGITLIRNGNKLGYPWQACIEQLFSVCEKVIVNVDPGDDDTLDQVIYFASQVPEPYECHVHVEKWDMSNTGDGSELAKQANNLLEYIPKNEWVVYMQADELIHEKDAEHLKKLMSRLHSDYTQIELFRTYFWGNLWTRNSKYEIWLGRIFRNGTHKIGGDGMYLVRESGHAFRSNAMIYHYSRMGDPDLVTLRIRTLDGLFHDEKQIATFAPFSYTTNIDELIVHSGNHPEAIEGFYEQEQE